MKKKCFMQSTRKNTHNKMLLILFEITNIYNIINMLLCEWRISECLNEEKSGKREREKKNY